MFLHLPHHRFYCGLSIKVLMPLLFTLFVLNVSGQAGKNDCKLETLPSVTFQAGSAVLKATAMKILDAVAESLQQNPGCKIKIIGYGSSDKRSQQLSVDHVSVVFRYLIENGKIAENRIMARPGNSGLATTVDLTPTTEDPNAIPVPSKPQYKNGN